jgi:3-methyladenine DNA glycosylase AlkD
VSDEDAVEAIVERLRLLARPPALAGMARVGIATGFALGVSMPDLRALAKSRGRNHSLALALWRRPLRETRILATLMADPKQVTGGGGGGATPLSSARKRASIACVSAFILLVTKLCG